jgi:uncharacterized protein YecE (DUF72 family)
MPRRVFIGTAGWSIPRASADHCPGDGTHLQRYARVFRAAEINSSFHRPHSPETYRKWARSTGLSFRFAVKLPRVITHDLKLRAARRPLEQFLQESAGLGVRRGPLLVQLPPSLAFEKRAARTFFDLLRSRFDGFVVCEPRHLGIVYSRLHGSPDKYWSRYDKEYIAKLAGALQQVPASVPAWCIFDNTASGAALENAWELQLAGSR